MSILFVFFFILSFRTQLRFEFLLILNSYKWMLCHVVTFFKGMGIGRFERSEMGSIGRHSKRLPWVHHFAPSAFDRRTTVYSTTRQNLHRALYIRFNSAAYYLLSNDLLSCFYDVPLLLLSSRTNKKLLVLFRPSSSPTFSRMGLFFSCAFPSQRSFNLSIKTQTIN